MTALKITMMVLNLGFAVLNIAAGNYGYALLNTFCAWLMAVTAADE